MLGRSISRRNEQLLRRLRVMIGPFSIVTAALLLLEVTAAGLLPAGLGAGFIASAAPVPGRVRTKASAANRPVVAPTVPAILVQTIQTSQFSPASPDPSGIAYLPESDHLLIVDSEVDETTGAGYHGVNAWEINRSGSVFLTGTTLSWLPINREPTGAGYDPWTQTLYVTTDVPSTSNKIYIVKRGSRRPVWHRRR
jgi:hypothetical protein